MQFRQILNTVKIYEETIVLIMFGLLLTMGVLLRSVFVHVKRKKVEGEECAKITQEDHICSIKK